MGKWGAKRGVKLDVLYRNAKVDNSGEEHRLKATYQVESINDNN